MEHVHGNKSCCTYKCAFVNRKLILSIVKDFLDFATLVYSN